MNFPDFSELVIIVASNFVTLIVVAWNFRIKLEQRLVALEIRVKNVEDFLKGN